jgi:transcriptional regulator with XRE-family HTH domain
VILGDNLSVLRVDAGLSQREFALGAGMSPKSIYRIEAGVRRTRESTLHRIAEVLVETEPNYGPVDRLTAYLVELAGPALAPESQYRDRVERRRARRLEKQTRFAA